MPEKIKELNQNLRFAFSKYFSNENCCCVFWTLGLNADEWDKVNELINNE